MKKQSLTELELVFERKILQLTWKYLSIKALSLSKDDLKVSLLVFYQSQRKNYQKTDKVQKALEVIKFLSPIQHSQINESLYSIKKNNNLKCKKKIALKAYRDIQKTVYEQRLFPARPKSKVNKGYFHLESNKTKIESEINDKKANISELSLTTSLELAENRRLNHNSKIPEEIALEILYIIELCRENNLSLNWFRKFFSKSNESILTFLLTKFPVIDEYNKKKRDSDESTSDDKELSNEQPRDNKSNNQKQVNDKVSPSSRWIEYITDQNEVKKINKKEVTTKEKENLYTIFQECSFEDYPYHTQLNYPMCNTEKTQYNEDISQYKKTLLKRLYKAWGSPKDFQNWKKDLYISFSKNSPSYLKEYNLKQPSLD